MPRTALAGASDLVTRAGTAVAGEGGSVVDVAVAASLTAMCIDPGVCAPLGGGYLTIDLPGRDPVVIDGYMAFPGLGFSGESFTRTVTMEYGGGVTTLVDAGSVAVPGAFAAFEMANSRYGVVPWKLIMDIVAEIVEPGFPLLSTAVIYLTEGANQIFDQDPISRQALFEDGEVAALGSVVRFDDLAPTLRIIGAEGVDVLYRGELGQAIADDLQERGGRLTRIDLESYEAIARPPLQVEMAGWDLITNPAPAVGGVALSLALSAISAAGDPLDPGVWFDALRRCFELRAERLEPAVDREAATRVLLEEAGIRSASTIAVAAVERDGGAVAASFSAGYGAGVVPKGTGMLMNNSVGEIELLPGGMEAQRPGERMLSNMAPTLARASGRVIALASPGADRITSALTIALARAALGGDDLASAIDHPRLHPEKLDGRVRAALEPGIDLAGHEMEIRRYPDRHMYFGGVAGADLDGSVLSAHADPRRVGSVALID